MTQTHKGGGATPAKSRRGSGGGARAGAKQNGELPGWTNGLRQLYDQVVDEELPDSFRDLLNRLDDQT